MNQKTIKTVNYFLLLCLLGFNACKDSNNYSTQPIEQPVSFYEPIVKNFYEDKIKFLFNQNEAKDQKTKSFLTINDYINFSFKTASGHLATSEDLKNSQIKVLTTCVSQNKQIFEKNTQQNLKPIIFFISLLPQEVLMLHKNNAPPICDFYFTVIQNNSLHTFNISKIPVIGYKKHHLIDLVEKQISPANSVTFKKITLDYPYIFFEQKNKQLVIKNDNIFFSTDKTHLKDKFAFSKMDSFRLECDYFTSTYRSNTNSLITFNVFLKNKTKKDNNLYEDQMSQNPIQNCRIIGFYRGHIVATSISFFFINLNHQVKPSIKFNIQRISNNTGKSLYHTFQLDGEPNLNRKDINLYDYQIVNPYLHSLSIIIKNYKKNHKKNEISLFGLYQYNNNAFYSKHSSIIKWGKPSLISLSSSKPSTPFHKLIKNSNSLLITIPPKSAINIPVFITKDMQLCYSSEPIPLYWLGAVTQIPNLSIAYLVTNNQSYTRPKSHILFNKEHSFSNRLNYDFRWLEHPLWPKEDIIKNIQTPKIFHLQSIESHFRSGICGSQININFETPPEKCLHISLTVDMFFSSFMSPSFPKNWSLGCSDYYYGIGVFKSGDKVANTIIDSSDKGILSPVLRDERNRLIAEAKAKERAKILAAIKAKKRRKAEARAKERAKILAAIKTKKIREREAKIEECDQRNRSSKGLLSHSYWVYDYECHDIYAPRM